MPKIAVLRLAECKSAITVSQTAVKLRPLSHSHVRASIGAQFWRDITPNRCCVRPLRDT
jgi:hypothetical protein